MLRLLEESPVAIAGAFLVSGWTGLLHNPAFDPLIGSFFADPLDWPSIRANCRVFRSYHGDNDPYVPLALGEQLASELNGVDLGNGTVQVGEDVTGPVALAIYTGLRAELLGTVG